MSSSLACADASPSTAAHRSVAPLCGAVVQHRCAATLCGTAVRRRCAAPLRGNAVRHRRAAPLCGIIVQCRCAAPFSSTIVHCRCAAPLCGREPSKQPALRLTQVKAALGTTEARLLCSAYPYFYVDCFYVLIIGNSLNCEHTRAHVPKS